MENCKELFKKYNDINGVYYSFRQNKTLDINPKYYWNGTPSAIYCYDLNRTKLHQSTFRSLKNNGYVCFFKIKKCKYLDLGKYTKEQYLHDLDILKKLYPNILTIEFEEKVYDTINNSRNIYSSKIWEITKRLSKRLIKPTLDNNGDEFHDYYKKWREIFKDELGYKYVEDPGFGIIYNMSEPEQIAIFDKDIIEILEFCEYDKTLFESKIISFANYLLS